MPASTLKPPASPNVTLPTGRVFYNAQSDFGAYGNGSNDDTGALTAAIRQSRTDNIPLYLPAGTYRATSSLTSVSSTSRIHIKGAGVGLTKLQIEVSGIEMLGGSFGSLSASLSITSGSSVGATQLTISSTSSLAAGDFIVVRDSTNIIYGNTGKTQAGVAGEIAEIKSVDSLTQITLRGRLDFAYTTSGDVRKLSYLDGFEISDLTIANPHPGTGTSAANRAIALTYARRVRIANVDFQNLDASAIRFAKVWDFDVTDCNFRDIRDTETSNNPYCVHLAELCENGLVSNCWGRYGRHLFTAGGGTTSEPQAAHVKVSDCTGTGFSETTFDTHPGARWITFSNCESHNGTSYGFQLRGPDNHVIEPIVSQATTGVKFINGADRGLLRGGKLSGCDTGIEVNASTDCTVKGTRIYSPTTYGVNVLEESASWTGYVTDFEIDDVRVTGTPATAAFNYSAWNDSFQIGRLYAPSAANKVVSSSVNTPNLYGLQNYAFKGLIAPDAPLLDKGDITLSANVARLARFVPERNMTITSLSFVLITAAGSNDAVDVGIYGPHASASTITRLVSSGATSGKLNAGNNTIQTISVSATKLVAGTVYYIALAPGAIGGTAAVIGGAGTGDNTYNQLVSNAVPFTICGSKASSHPLPSTLGGLSQQGLGPYMAALES